MPDHQLYMQRCLELAELGAGFVSPNPMVGAVVVCDDKVIGESYHKQYGGPHAEVNAINQVVEKYPDAIDLLKKSTIYVSLEPCAHYGKTPPCADLIIKHQIPNVVVGCRDPFPQVDGKGIDKLKAAGVDVTVGALEQESRRLNRRFFTRVQKQRPYIILKWAQTVDGFFAPDDGSQHWITGPESRNLVHQWRAEEDAILVGRNTALNDNPQLNVRYAEGRNPKRVVIDRELTLPKDLHLFDQSTETLIFNELKTDIEGNVKYIALEDFNHYLPQYMMYQLWMQDIQSVIIEGGAHTLNSFIKDGLWDEARIFTGPGVLNQGIPAPVISGTNGGHYTVGADQLQLFYNS
ncbi:bifunctional diaminohydroxyphosphoribosylaminopyrimidine deaminase/5-amino-6-(5-phosphoribosylamino)uracil reductase RibD [Mucilaginibacter terrenus]|uniref:Riboflavin biosynthesis protein RibD n=1 Tax=Mucilaginibacter terrenus TaxID=2482727 RepID=A0A3E2NUX1_9SPHI|nr:bifunctional diaminohydroxyphosphoribosylaminopyrimidine deaminase/5-amino-6-(5-phosphoribosylamino)uracil reductase RibD [Mucilaginibacter terrenus]RFZ84650.1 bifunctional diaminohydroxyphosphoribosylaminopyrimidine deaminase/5-amino-6-(5-phosphoribosylamino)uracil reductase RibD [Mucilaginibacter terrenus]